MTRSFNDHYRPLRLILRLNGLLVGLGLGLALLLAPLQLLAIWGLVAEQTSWPARLGGSGLIAAGLHTLAAADAETMQTRPLLAIMGANGLLTLVLFLSYVQGDLTNLTATGQIVLLALFVLSLASAVLPIYYFRRDLVL